MFKNLFSKIMGSYILIPILILLVLLILLPNYLEDYFFQAKEEELLRKGEVAVRLVNVNSNLNNLLATLEKLLDTSLLVVNQKGEIINQGRMMMGMMRNSQMMRHMGMNKRMMDHMLRNNGMRHLGMKTLPQIMPEFKEELNKVLAGRQVTFQGEIPMLNQSIIGVGIPLHTSKSRGLFLISPLRGLQQTVVKVRNLTIRVTLGAIFLSLLLGYFISKGISHPVQEMKDKAQRMAAGDFKVKLNDLPQDEIGELGESFNYLSSRLEENINALDTEKRRMKEMLTSMGEGVLGISVEKEILLANPRLQEIFEVQEEIIGREYSCLFADELINLVDEVLKEQEEIKEEFEWQDQIIVAHAAPIQEADGALWGIIILIRDITEIRKLDEMRRLFVANVSHELKTPLTAIRGYLEAILDGVIDDVELQSEYLRRVLSETNRMTRLVNDTLDLSRLQAGQFEFDLEEVDLVGLIKSVVTNLESKIKSRNVIIDGVKEVTVISDWDKLEEVIVNLLNNAIKFTAEDGEIKVTIEQEDDKIKVEVSDDGIGIPACELPYIWERFHQVDRARRPDKEGTGLGLAIVKEIIEGLGGEVAVESKEGVGSKFSFTLYSKP